jgi:hypothetical protein
MHVRSFSLPVWAGMKSDSSMLFPKLITNTLLVTASLAASVLLAEGLIRVLYPERLFFSLSQ